MISVTFQAIFRCYLSRLIRLRAHVYFHTTGGIKQLDTFNMTDQEYKDLLKWCRNKKNYHHPEFANKVALKTIAVDLKRAIGMCKHSIKETMRFLEMTKHDDKRAIMIANINKLKDEKRVYMQQFDELKM